MKRVRSLAWALCLLAGCTDVSVVSLGSQLDAEAESPDTDAGTRLDAALDAASPSADADTALDAAEHDAAERDAEHEDEEDPKDAGEHDDAGEDERREAEEETP